MKFPIKACQFDGCFPIVCLLVAILFLSGCAGECISDTGLHNLKTGTVKICPNPRDTDHEGCLRYMSLLDGDENKAKKYWVDLDLQVEPGDIFEYKIRESPDYAFCAPPCPDSCLNAKGEDFCNTPSCRSFEVSLPNKDALQRINLRDGDEVMIALRPALEGGIINDAICEGKNEQIYVGNYQECMRRKGEPYGALFAAGKNLATLKEGALDQFKVIYSLEDGISSEIGTIDFCKTVLYEYSLSPKYHKDIDHLKKRVSVGVLHSYCSKVLADAENFVISLYTPVIQLEKTNNFVMPYLQVFGVMEKDELCLLCSGGNSSVSKPAIQVPGLCGSAQFIGSTFPAVFLNRFFTVRSPSSAQLFGLQFVWGRNFITGIQGTFQFKVSRKCFNPGLDAIKVLISDNEPNFAPSINSSEAPLLPPGKPFHVERNGSVYVGIVDSRGDEKAESRGHILLEYTLKQQNGVRIFSKATNYIKSKIMVILYNRTVDEYGKFSESYEYGGGAVGTVYRAIAGSTLIKVIQASIVLYMTVYGLAFLFGLVRTPQADLVIFLMKLGIVVVLFSPNSWKFFNENLFQLFVDGSAQLINYFSGNGSGLDFAFLDRILSPFSTQENWLRIFSFLFSGCLGIFYFVLILVGMQQIIFSILKIIVAYIMSLVMVAILLCLAPIFISMVFFKRTKSIFDNWIKNLAQISVTPVITFAAFAVLAEVGLGIIYGLFNFQICPVCVIEPDMTLFKFCLLAVYLPSSYDFEGGIMAAQNAAGMPIGIGMIIAFMVISNAIVAFTSRAAILTSSIFGAIASDTTVPAEQFMDSMKAIVGQDGQAKYQKAHTKHVKELDQQKDEPEKPPKRDR